MLAPPREAGHFFLHGYPEAALAGEVHRLEITPAGLNVSAPLKDHALTRAMAVRPDGRVACGLRKNSRRLFKLYFFSNAPSGTEVVGNNSVPFASRGE